MNNRGTLIRNFNVKPQHCDYTLNLLKAYALHMKRQAANHYLNVEKGTCIIVSAYTYIQPRCGIMEIINDHLDNKNKTLQQG